MIPPKQWYEKYSSPSYRGFWSRFEGWLAERGITWRGLLQRKPKQIRNLVDEYLLDVKDKYTTKSLLTSNAVIRSYLQANDITLPRSRIAIRGGKPMTASKLTPKNLGEILTSISTLRDRSLFTFKFQSIQDNARMLWISQNAWHQIRPQLDDGGWMDPNGKLWKDVLRVDMLCGRKLNIDRAYFCFVGKDAIDALRKYFHVEGGPDKRGGVIWGGLSSTNSYHMAYVRHLRKMGFVPRNQSSFDTGKRYGLNLHEFRDVAKSLWHESGADLLVCDFCMGHTVDAMGYDKIYTLSPDYAVKEFKKAESYLNIISGKRMTPSDESDMENRLDELRKRNEAQADKMEKLEEELSRLLELMKRRKDED
ncbi:hypothetical protein [[Eubacterium] cellulosolvens]